MQSVENGREPIIEIKSLKIAFTDASSKDIFGDFAEKAYRNNKLSKNNLKKLIERIRTISSYIKRKP